MSLTIVTQQRNYQQPVEQQTLGGAAQLDRSLWVLNPLAQVAWDADDKVDINLQGSLNPGEQSEHTELLMADWMAHIIGMSAGAKQAKGVNLEIQLSFEWTDLTGQHQFERPWLAGVSGGRRISAVMGVLGPDFDNGSVKLGPVENSNGGKGALTKIHFRVRNSGVRRMDNVGLKCLIAVNGNAYWPMWLPCSPAVHVEGHDPRMGWCV